MGVSRYFESTARMIEWLMATPTPSPLKKSLDATRPAAGADDTPIADLPDTPAPVFALRAFKTALFGTPREEPVTEPSAPLPETPVPGRSTRRASHQEDGQLPSKPPGILLTPGTVSTRRKTVSFGAAVVDNEGKPPMAPASGGVPKNCPGRYPSPWSPKTVTPSSSTTHTSLTRSFYEARETKDANLPGNGEDRADSINPESHTRGYGDSRKASHFPTRRSSIGARPGDAVAEKVEKVEEVEEEGDVTLDLAEPRSASGKYWKAELYNYHEKMLEEVKKLVKYRHMAKSYAMKKDAEAVELKEQLRGERRKNARLEKEAMELRQIRDKIYERGDLRAEMDDLRDRVRMAEERTSKVERKNAFLTSELAQAEERARTVERKRSSLASELAQALERAGLVERKNASLTSELAQAKEELDGRKSQRADREERQCAVRPILKTRSRNAQALPPDRAAAAQARLEERRRLQRQQEDEQQQENIHP
ncbi:MAG: hypothetical protein M1832_005850 [Thelocarpon impressellum]|nr:MAG: hypothetical protein M1832_005850 [Thelocarpon impressellum]